MSAVGDHYQRWATAIRRWVRTNITGDGPGTFYRQQGAKPRSLEEELRLTMEKTEAVPPSPFSGEKDAEKKFVEFWVSKLVDAVMSGIGALFLWVVLRITGKKPIPEAGAKQNEAVERILPFAVWIVCFVVLWVRRFLRERKAR